MYAVIETGGKQYRVELGTELEVELLEAEPGSAVTLERVLLVADGDEAAIGHPVVGDAVVEARVLGRERGEKVIAFKYRPKARRRVKKGHRQELTRLQIADIRFNGRSAAADAQAADAAARADREQAEAAAARQAAQDAALAAKLASAAEPAKKPRTKAAAGTATEDTTETAAPARRPRAKAADAAKPADAKTQAPAPKRTRAKKDE